jgi:hypothetical protein
MLAIKVNKAKSPLIAPETRAGTSDKQAAIPSPKKNLANTLTGRALGIASAQFAKAGKQFRRAKLECQAIC